LKREPAPGFWPIRRKEMAWAPMTRPGPHRRDRSLPLVIVIREILGYARTAKEAIHIISTGRVKVDRVVRRDHRFPVGLMDVLEIEGSPQSFRVLPRPDKGLTAVPIEKGESGFKLCKIVGKKTVEGGRTQLNFHDGRNLILQAREPRQKPGEEYAVGGAIQLGIPEQKIVGHIPFQQGALGLFVAGRNKEGEKSHQGLWSEKERTNSRGRDAQGKRRRRILETSPRRRQQQSQRVQLRRIWQLLLRNQGAYRNPRNQVRPRARNIRSDHSRHSGTPGIPDQIPRNTPGQDRAQPLRVAGGSSNVHAEQLRNKYSK